MAIFNEPKIAIFAIWQKYEGCEIQRGARESEVYWQAYKLGKGPAILRQHLDWVGGFRNWSFLLIVSTVLILIVGGWVQKE